MNRWKVYSYLKRNEGKVNEDFTDMFMNLPPKEIQEGVYEYELMQEKNADYYNPIDWGVK